MKAGTNPKSKYFFMLICVFSIIISACGAQKQADKSVADHTIESRLQESDITVAGPEKEAEEEPAAPAMEKTIEEPSVIATEEAEKPEDHTATEDALFEDMARYGYSFSSGVGGWGTDLSINPDGTFSGSYSDSDMGSTGEGFPNGTLYYCEFNGRFSHAMDMSGLDNPVVYGKDWLGRQETNAYAASFASALVNSVSSTIHMASDREWEPSSLGRQVANWFINNYPLFGALAASFEIVEDLEECRRLDISTAAVNAWEGVIYINTSIQHSVEEWRFIMAHEFLHAALLHHRRCEGRDPYLWNLATDFVINGWLFEMQIGVMPEGVLFDPAFRNMSAEEIYDIINEDFKRYIKMNTFRGNGHGDIMGRSTGRFGEKGNGVSLDEFYRNALTQGLEYESMRRRGLVPAGLVEEIRALAVPPVPWDVKLAEWFNLHIRSVEKHRSYAHPSRRQSCTPDIPRPRYVITENRDNARTFGVIIDTSGSMKPSEIGKALGAVASYAAARDVPAARVVFCDAAAYDNGYMSPEEIAGRVEVKGRGGTRIQPAIELLQHAKDFPKDGPILIITDGEIEGHLDIRRTHAFILPSGCRLPFKARGEVFYF